MAVKTDAKPVPQRQAYAMLDDENAPEIPADFPVLPAAAPQMNIDVVVNRDHKVWVLHDRPFPDYLEWIEFDAATGAMTFIAAGGKLQDLGMTIHPPMDKYVKEAKEVCVMMIRDGAVRDMGMVPLTVQGR